MNDYYLKNLCQDSLLVSPRKSSSFFENMPQICSFLETYADEIVLKLNLYRRKKAYLWYAGAYKPVVLFDWMINNIINHQGFSIITTDMMNNNIIRPDFGIQIASIVLTPTVIRLLQEISEQPELKGGLVRVHDERQVAIANNFTPHLTNYTQESAVQKTRKEYWELDYLAEFNREWRQSLEVNNSNSNLEFTYYVREDGTGPRGKFVSRFKLVEDEQGVLYQVVNSLETP